MKLRKWISKLIVGLFLPFVSQDASAMKMKGYDNPSKVKPLVLNEVVERFRESKDEFLIVFSGHAAIYRFPKSGDITNRAREFLKEKVNSKKKISATIDPKSAKILFLEDSRAKKGLD